MEELTLQTLDGDEEYISQLIERARSAQRTIEHWSQPKVDALVRAVAWRAYDEATANRLVTLACNETRFGRSEDSILRHRQRVLGTLSDLHGVVTTGIIDADPARGLRRVAKPIGVIAAITPATAPTAAVVQNALLALKTRNAVIFSPNPRAQRTGVATVDELRSALSATGAPADLVQCVEHPTKTRLQTLMRAADLILAAGGSNTVRRAYSSGTPAYGAGVGNAVAIIDESANVEDAAAKIYHGKTFDNGTSCSSESCVLAAEEISHQATEILRSLGAHVCTSAELAKLRALAWPDGHTLNRALVGADAETIAMLAGIRVGPGTRALLALPEGGIDHDPVGTEKLSPILALWRYHKFEQAIDFARRLTSRSGRGHSCAIHTTRSERVDQLAQSITVSRVLVNQSTGSGNSGSFTNAMPFTAILCCGTWGSSITNENITWKHLLNYTWVAEPLRQRPIDERELFGSCMRDTQA